MALTRLSVDGYGARRAGSFAGRAEVIALVTQRDGSGFDRFKDLKPLKKRLKEKELPEEVIEIIEEIIAIQGIEAPKAPIKTLKQELKQQEIKYEPIFGELLKIELEIAITFQKQRLYEQEEEELLILMAA